MRRHRVSELSNPSRGVSMQREQKWRSRDARRENCGVLPRARSLRRSNFIQEHAPMSTTGAPPPDISAAPSAVVATPPSGVTGSIPRELGRLALPLFASYLLRVAYQWVDALWVRGL